jgi:hypothetical protein
MDIIRKDKNMIVYNQANTHIPSTFMAHPPARKRSRKSRGALRSSKQQQRDRIAEKQDLLLETVKQKVALQKLFQRNI